MERAVSILGSGMGLGVYIPSLLINSRLNTQGIRSEVFVVESYFSEDKIEKLSENRKAFHDSFKVAVFGHKMAKGDVKPNLDNAKINQLLDYWEKNERTDFIVLSGHWPCILESYIERVFAPLHIDTVHLDCAAAPSWKNFSNAKNHFNDIWLFDNNKKDLPCCIFADDPDTIPFHEREDRFLIHGGGWGMGTYRSKISELNERNFSLDIVAYENDEIKDFSHGNSYLLMEPGWDPWIKNKNNAYNFPPMYQVDAKSKPLLLQSKTHHALYDVCRNYKAIISKPGGGSLIDSLSAAVPLIFIEPIAKHEEMNALFWEGLGFGISYDTWAGSGFSQAMLEDIHHNILDKRKRVPDYVDGFLKMYGYT